MTALSHLALLLVDQPQEFLTTTPPLDLCAPFSKQKPTKIETVLAGRTHGRVTILNLNQKRSTAINVSGTIILKLFFKIANSISLLRPYEASYGRTVLENFLSTGTAVPYQVMRLIV